MALSTYLAGELADHCYTEGAFAVPTAWYVQTHTANPTAAGTTAPYNGWDANRAEVTSWSTAANVASNAAAVTFETCDDDSTTITHISIWDAITAGNCLAYGPLTTSKSCDTGDDLNFDIGEIDVTFSTTADDA